MVVHSITEDRVYQTKSYYNLNESLHRVFRWVGCVSIGFEIDIVNNLKPETLFLIILYCQFHWASKRVGSRIVNNCQRTNIVTGNIACIRVQDWHSASPHSKEYLECLEHYRIGAPTSESIL